jgi:hypothetical protein
MFTYCLKISLQTIEISSLGHKKNPAALPDFYCQRC